jgi:hypothetical protein
MSTLNSTRLHSTAVHCTALNNWTESSQSQSQSQSHIETDCQSISKSWCGAHLGLMNRYVFITVWQLRSWFCGAPSLTRGRVCLLYMLLALASVVFLGSESLWTRDHIILSQIWDFPFRRLLRLAGSRWRYSNPPPHGWLNWSRSVHWYGPRADHIENITYNSFPIVASHSWRKDRVENAASKVIPLVLVRKVLPSNGRCLQSHYLATGLHATYNIHADQYMYVYMFCICRHILYMHTYLCVHVWGRVSALRYAYVDAWMDRRMKWWLNDDGWTDGRTDGSVGQRIGRRMCEGGI